MKWTTRDGTIMDVREMGDSHLQNAINMLKRQIDVGLDLLGSGSPSADCSDAVWLACVSECNANEQRLDNLYASLSGLEKEQKRRNKILIHPHII